MVQRRTHVDTVLKSLCGVANSRNICWSHTMKELGSLVTFVRRNSVPKVTLRNTCSDMEMWSRIFAMNVQNVSTQHLNWNGIGQFILTTDSFAVSYVTRSSSVNARSREVFCSTRCQRPSAMITNSVFGQRQMTLADRNLALCLVACWQCCKVTFVLAILGSFMHSMLYLQWHAVL